uniref:F-box domain-containing protein n=1 Tax=Aegilops tauschii TaxID=37682 RepID=M8BPJ1_AEGTA
MPSPPTEIPGHLLVEIFLRLPTAEDLARASAACVSFRRLATDGSFLCSFRRLHAPPLLGFLDYGRFRPALPPHPSAPAARALAVAADFYFSFIDSYCHWTVQDSRDGRVLLDRDLRQHEQPLVFKDLAVCDPLHRRLAAFVFSSSTGQWQAAASKGCSDLALGKHDMAGMSWVHLFILRCHYAYGCFYWDWVEFGRKKLLLLDTRKMEFSIADLLPGEWNKEGLAIVEAAEGRLGMLGFHGETSSNLIYTVARNKGESPSQWQAEKTILLDSVYKYRIGDATQRYLLLTRIDASSSLNDRLTGYFSMDVKTLQIQRVYEKHHYRLHETYPYINFPPSLLSSRRI